MRKDEYIYDWNEARRDAPPFSRNLALVDETLRDGIQSPSVRNPSIGEKLELLHCMEALGIDVANVGLPGAGAAAVADVRRLCEEIRDARLAIRPSCAARTHEGDVRAVVELAQRTGVEIECCAFIGSSPVRQLVERWEQGRMVRLVTDAMDLAVGAGLPATFVTEDTIRSDPDLLRALWTAAIDHGARRIVLTDTVGHATPDGLANLVAFAREVIAESGAPVALDWHGHNDRGLALSVALWAFERGVDRVHGTCLGVGERVGNAPIDLLILNLSLLGVLDRDLHALRHYVERVSACYDVHVPHNYPAFGQDAFRTATGVHAAAIAKAMQLGRTDLADRVYSSVPAHALGCQQHIEVGFYSGRANVVRWLEERGLAVTEERVRRVLERAKRARATLTEGELLEALLEPGC